MSKKKLAGIIVGCITAIIVVIVIVTHSPTAPPEYTMVSAYDFAKELFNPELTSLQREDLWEDYEGKQVKWINELKSVALGNEELVAYFLNPLDWERTEVVAAFDESQRSSLLELKEGDLVIYTGVLASFGQTEISLTDCTVISLAIVPLWWNNDIDTHSKRILVGDEVLCLGPTTYDDVIGNFWSLPPTITAINRETGELPWELKNTYSVLVGIDSRYIYAWQFTGVRYWYAGGYRFADWVGPSNITALDKVSGQIGWTSSLSYGASCLPFTLYPEASIPDCVDYWILQIYGTGNETTNNGEPGLILLISKPPLSELTYEHEGVIYESACAVYGGSGTECSALQAIDQETGGVLWIMTFEERGMNDFSIVDGILYVSTDEGVGAFELPNLTDLQIPDWSETGS